MKHTKARKHTKALARVHRKTAIAPMAKGAMKTYKEAILAKWPEADIGEVQLLLLTAKRMGLDPLSNQIHLIPRWDSKLGRKRSTVQVGIDGCRATAERPPDGQPSTYAGSDGATYNEGKTLDEMAKDGAKWPRTCRVVGHKVMGGMKIDVVGEVTWTARAQFKQDGTLVGQWATDPYGMLAKCAEMLMLRKGWPKVFSDVYIPEEMPSDAGAPVPAAAVTAKPAKALPAPSTVAATPEQQKAETGQSEEWVRLNRALHAQATRLSLKAEPLHAYIHAQEKAESLKVLAPDRLRAWVDELSRMKVGGEEHMAAIGKLAKYEGKP